MAHKVYYINSKQINDFVDKMEANSFIPLSSVAVVDVVENKNPSGLNIYEINNVAVILPYNYKGFEKTPRRIDMVGELKNIIKTKSEIEEKIKCRLEEIIN